MNTDAQDRNPHMIIKTLSYAHVKTIYLTLLPVILSPDNFDILFNGSRRWGSKFIDAIHRKRYIFPHAEKAFNLMLSKTRERPNN